MEVTKSGRPGAIFLCKHQKVEPTFLRQVRQKNNCVLDFSFQNVIVIAEIVGYIFVKITIISWICLKVVHGDTEFTTHHVADKNLNNFEHKNKSEAKNELTTNLEIIFEP